jgi:hypothetical protein
MNKPSSFSLSSLSVSLAKIPKTYLYAAAGSVLLTALGVVGYNMLNPAVPEEVINPAPITAPSNPATSAAGDTGTVIANDQTGNTAAGNTGTGNTGTGTATTGAPGNTSNPSGSDDIGGGPSRSLEVQPIPFLVTEAVKNDPNNPTKATTQALNTRPASSAVVNPFAPLSVESTGDIAVVQNGSNPNFGSGNMAPQQPVNRPSASLPPVRQTRTVTIIRPQPLPNFNRPQTNSKPTPNPTVSLPKPGGTIIIKPPTQNGKVIAKIPAAIANAKPSIKAPKPGVSGPSSSVALTNPTPSTPGLMRNVVPAKPTVVQPPVDPGTAVIPTVPTDPELDFAALTEPNILGGPIELREPGQSSIETPSPLDSSIPRTPVKPADPVNNPGQPEVIPAVIDSLTAFVNARGVSFVGVVLGPVNTAIFETKDGTVVVPLGANMPQSDVIVKTITADQVVLMQGQDTIILSRAK